MDDGQLAALINESVRASTNMMDINRKYIKEQESIIDSLAEGIQGLTSAMDVQTSARTGRIRFSVIVGSCALAAGVLALWGSSSIRSGFFQALLIALGGALITFCLVELILNKIVEIPAKQAKEIAKLVNHLKSLNAEMAGKAHDLRESTKGAGAELDGKILDMKRRLGD